MRMDFVEIRFRSGENSRLFGAAEAAKKGGYPDVLGYLRCTGQVKGWCEVVPQSEVDESLLAEKLRAETQRISTNYPLVWYPIPAVMATKRLEDIEPC